MEQWRIEYNSGIPVYRQIVNLVEAAVAAGALRRGERLPTIRALHEQLGVNPNTVAKAYRELELKGVLVSERGTGSFISEECPTPGAREKKARLKGIYQRLLAEAASNGLTEEDLVNFLNERKA